MYRTIIIVILLLLSHSSFADAFDRKGLVVHRCSVAPEIDGDLSDDAWSKVEPVDGFIQNSPFPGSPSSQKTKVKMLFDDQAIYIAAMMYESSRDSVTATLSQRDDVGNADYFGAILDPYGSGLNAFGYYVTAAGVQRDVRFTGDWPDGSLNMVWESRVKVKENGWSVEMRIPYSAIRFPRESVKNWRINFERRIRRIRETSHWNTVDPEKYGFLNQSGELIGIDSVKSPLRLALFPYVSAYAEHYPYDTDELDNTSYTFNGGMDLKYGISESFTLDMTLVPDFGQVQFDNQVLNLSPFEVRYNERRQFFTEGMELYNRGGLFYSRRVGGTPLFINAPYDGLAADETVVENPSESRLINATKVSGRTRNGLGVGVFNGLTRRMYAVIENEAGEQRSVLTDPLTNYSVLVLDKNLPNNSSISLINTNVMRDGTTYDANVTGAYFTLQNNSQRYAVSSGGSVSQKIFTDSLGAGHTWYASLSKVAGNFTWDIGYSQESDTYDPNDLGFLTNNNSRNTWASLRYQWFKPFWKALRAGVGSYIWYNRLFDPDVFTGLGVNLDGHFTWKNFLSTGAWVNSRVVEGFDYFEPRVPGRYYENPRSISFGGFSSSDYRKAFALDLRTTYTKYDRDDRHDLYARISPRIRIGERVMLIYTLDRNYQRNSEGAAININTGGGTIIGDSIIFAKRDRTTITNTIDLNYIFTNRMGITFRMRHYWSKVAYNSFHALSETGKLLSSSYDGLDVNGESVHNNSYNAFTIDMAYRWVFAPGSEMSVVWKNSIFTSGNVVNLDYIRNVENLLQQPQTNSLSIKVLYYLDYAMVTRKTHRIRN